MKLKLLYKDIFYQTLIKEGVYDQSIFKAIIMAGGPGSGKSYISNKLLKGFGLKFVNSDFFLELLFKKRGLSLDMPPETIVQTNLAYDTAKNLSQNQLNIYLNGRLGLVIDGTGRDYNRIENSVQQLQKLGYDVAMIFVNTDLNTALERNANRQRKVPKEFVIKSWEQVQKNIGKFQSLFGMKNFIIIDNSTNTTDSELLNNIQKGIRHFLSQPIRNPAAKQWIDQELMTRKR